MVLSTAFFISLLYIHHGKELSCMYVVAIVYQHDRETEGVNNNVSKGERICYQALIIIFEVNFSIYTCSIFIGLVWATFVMRKLLPCSLTEAQTFFLLCSLLWLLLC